MKIDNLNSYQNNPNIFDKIVDKIYEISKHLNKSYPNYEKWFYETHIAGCKENKRDIIFVTNEQEQIVAISCLKKHKEEKKICTLLVLEKYRKQGVSDLILKASFKYLGTTKPLITISEDNVSSFEKIISKFEWELCEVVDGIYCDNKKEFCFNGKITNKNI